MRVLIKKVESGQYYRSPNTWTDDALRAFDFTSIEPALRYIETWGLTGVEMAFAFPESETVATAPLERSALSTCVR